MERRVINSFYLRDLPLLTLCILLTRRVCTDYSLPGLFRAGARTLPPSALPPSRTFYIRNNIQRIKEVFARLVLFGINLHKKVSLRNMRLYRDIYCFHMC